MVKRLFMVAVVLTLSLWMGLGSLTYAEPTDSRFEALSKELYPKAKQEGGLTIYTVEDVADVVVLLNDFSKQFPGIKTNYWQAQNPTIITRVLTEFQAGQASVDVILTDTSVTILRAAGAMMHYETVQKDSLIFHDPDMPVVYLTVQVMAYNTKKMKAEDLPKSWEDLTNPKYKGLVALDDPMRSGPLSIQLAILKEYWKDDARWTRFIKGLKALNVPVHRSTGGMFRLVVSGEYSIAEPCLFEDLMEDQEKGGIMGYVKSAPPIIAPRYAGIYGKPPHPSAAKLFAEWLISPTGQASLDSVRRTAVRKGFKGAKASLEGRWPPDIKPIGGTDREFLENPKKWLDTYVKPVWEGK